jgi:hypothetical protein
MMASNSHDVEMCLKVSHGTAFDPMQACKHFFPELLIAR